MSFWLTRNIDRGSNVPFGLEFAVWACNSQPLQHAYVDPVSTVRAEARAVEGIVHHRGMCCLVTSAARMLEHECLPGKCRWEFP